jgi:uncharacterized protein (DUF927 family)
VLALLAAAEPPGRDAVIQGNYRVVRRSCGGDAAGAYRQVEREDRETGTTSPEWVWFASRVDVLAHTRNSDGEAWGRLLGIHDPDGNVHQWAMPMSLMAGSGESYREELLRLGMTLSPHPKARGWLAEYLSTWRPEAKARCVERVGWHQSVFVLPDRTFGATEGESVLLQVSGPAARFSVEGTLDGWQQEIARHAAGNSRLALAISAALAGPLLRLANEESGGFHFWGASSIGKTTALHAARSVWGQEPGSWRTTDNAAESTAAAACDTLLTLDEIGQATPQAVSDLAYMLGNQRGKARMRRDATARQSLTWRLLFLSTGELGLAARLAEGGRRAMAGQSVRVVELPADAGAGHGIFDELHGFGGGADLAEHLRQATDRQCGHAGRLYLERLTGSLEECRELIRAARHRFIVEQCPAGADGQAQRVCGRFALVAAAGELGIKFGVLPWPPGEAEAAAVRCFSDWLMQRGGTAPAEIVAGLRQVQLFLEQHGSSRFEPAWAEGDSHPGRTINRAGFRRADDSGAWRYYVLPESWAAEVCKGFDPMLLARAMIEGGWMEPGEGKNLAKRVRVPMAGNPRLYCIAPSFSERDAHADR